MGRDRPVSRKEGKGECNNEWGEGEKPGFVVVFVFSSRRGRCGRKEWEGHGDREKMRESETKPQEYGTSYHLVELYSTVLRH